MAYSIALRADPVRTLAFGGIGASYAPIGTQLTKGGRQFFVQNLTDATLMFSFDGVNDHFPLLSNTYFVFDVTTNKVTNDGWFIEKNTIMNVKEIGTPTTGSVYLSVFYGQGD